MKTTTMKKPDNYIQDIKDFDKSERSIHLSAKAKNIEMLKDLNIENMWLIGGGEKEIEKILSQVKLKFLYYYQVLAKDLSVIEAQSEIETIELTWNTKLTKLWNVQKNKHLKHLSIIDFTKLEDVSELSFAQQVLSLNIEGGMNKPMIINTLSPLGSLTNLKYLGLQNIKIKDDTLKPIGSLKSLEELEISNQFDVKEYAWLATRLPKTNCSKFHAFSKCSIRNSKGEVIHDVMITGRRKPFLHSERDREKIEKYIYEFDRLKQELE